MGSASRPGAYLGRGRGNAFLNDLVDADSLVHVVDASGRSDAEGVDHGASKAWLRRQRGEALETSVTNWDDHFQWKRSNMVDGTPS